MDARDIIAELAGLYVAHWEEHDTAMKVGGYVPMDDDYPVTVPLRLLRLSYEKAMGAQSHSPDEAQGGFCAVTDLRKQISFAISDPGNAGEGYKGERTLTEWQVDAVMRVVGDREFVNTPPKSDLTGIKAHVHALHAAISQKPHSKMIPDNVGAYHEYNHSIERAANGIRDEIADIELKNAIRSAPKPVNEDDRPETIPVAIWKRCLELASFVGWRRDALLIEMMAKGVMEEREKCAKIADAEADQRMKNSQDAAAGSLEWGDPEKATFIQYGKSFTASHIATAIRKGEA
jgi:hypothetical protein